MALTDAPTTQELTLTYGKMNTKHDVLMSTVFKLNPPFSRVSAATSAPQKISQTYVDATNLGKPGGGFSTVRVGHVEGTVLMVQASLTRNRMRSADGSLLIRVRPTAPMLAITTKLPLSPNSILGERVAAFLGRGDILTPQEARALGFNISPSYERDYFDEDEVAELLDVKVMAPGTERPTITLVHRPGGKTEAVLTEPARARVVVARRRVR